MMTLLLVFTFIMPTVQVNAQTLKPLQPTVSTALQTASTNLVDSNLNPTFGSEWKIFTLARANYNVPKGYYEKYYLNVENHLKANAGNLGNRVSEYSRLIIALTAIGYDPKNVAGYNLLEKLVDYTKVTSQGINSAIFALIALDTQRFDIPQTNVADVTTREKLVSFILQQEIAQGGFALTGTVPDVDITAMAVQALAPYKDRTDVKSAIDRAVNVLDNVQLTNGGYDAGGENVQSAAQVVIALSTLGIDVAKDARFIQQDGSWILSNIMSYYTADGGFAHPKGGTTNAMATQQAASALAAYERLANNRTALYDTTDMLVTTQQFAVNVAVKGIHNTIVNSTSVTVAKGQTALEALQNLLDAKNIAYQITESSYGPYVASINDEQGGSLGGWDGWSYTVNGEMPNVGMSSYVLKENDALNVYYGRWASLTTTAVQANTVNPEVTVNLVGDTFTDAASNIANWTITAGDTNLTVASIEKLNNQRVKVKFNGTAEEGTLLFAAKANALDGNADSKVELKIVNERITAAKNKFQAFKQLKSGVQTSVASTHPFTVKFNQVIQAQDVPTGKITIWDAETNEAVATQVTQGDATSLKVKAVSPLQSQHYYYVVIYEGIVSNAKQSLKQGTVHLFKTQ